MIASWSIQKEVLKKGEINLIFVFFGATKP